MTFPETIYFCNKNIDDKMIKYANAWKLLNPNYEIKLYDNKMCEDFLLKNFGQLHKDIFVFIPHGPIKADFWRICILYIYGGVYSDIDNKPFIPLEKFIEKDVDFVTCSAYDPNYKFNPNFIISNKGNIILKNCIDWYIKKYVNKSPYSYMGWSIMGAFTDTLFLINYKLMDGIYESFINKLKIQIIKECPGKNHYDAHNLYKGMRVFNNRYEEWNHKTHSFR